MVEMDMRIDRSRSQDLDVDFRLRWIKIRGGGERRSEREANIIFARWLTQAAGRGPCACGFYTYPRRLATRSRVQCKFALAARNLTLDRALRYAQLQCTLEPLTIRS